MEDSNVVGSLYLCNDELEMVFSFLNVFELFNAELISTNTRFLMTTEDYRLWKDAFFRLVAKKHLPNFFSPKFESDDDIERLSQTNPAVWKKCCFKSLVTWDLISGQRDDRPFYRRNVIVAENKRMDEEKALYADRVFQFKGYLTPYDWTKGRRERRRNIRHKHGAFKDDTDYSKLVLSEKPIYKPSPFPPGPISRMRKRPERKRWALLHDFRNDEKRLNICDLIKVKFTFSKNFPQNFALVEEPSPYRNEYIDLSLVPSDLQKTSITNWKHAIDYHRHFAGENVLWEGTILEYLDSTDSFFSLSKKKNFPYNITLSVKIKDSTVVKTYLKIEEYDKEIISNKTLRVLRYLDIGDKIVFLGRLKEKSSNLSIVNLQILEYGTSISSEILRGLGYVFLNFFIPFCVHFVASFFDYYFSHFFFRLFIVYSSMIPVFCFMVFSVYLFLSSARIYEFLPLVAFIINFVAGFLGSIISWGFYPTWFSKFFWSCLLFWVSRSAYVKVKKVAECVMKRRIKIGDPRDVVIKKMKELGGKYEKTEDLLEILEE